MEINSVGASAMTAVSQAETGDAVALTVFKKALEAQRQGALQLIEAAQLPQASGGGSLGSHIDIKV